MKDNFNHHHKRVLNILKKKYPNTFPELTYKEIDAALSEEERKIFYLGQIILRTPKNETTLSGL